MIKIFRKIRQQLLNEGKTSKYLKYAFGEIILVVIGILIALQINNLNQKAQYKNSLTHVFIALKKENTSNIKSIESRINILTNDMTKVNNYLNILNTKSPSKVSDSILTRLIGYVGPISNPFLEDAAYEELLNSNLLDPLKEGDFKRKLFSHKNRITTHNEQTEEMNIAWENELRPYYVKHGNMVSMMDSILHIKLPKTYIKINRKSFINNNELNNILMNRLMTNMRSIQSLRMAKGEIEILTSEITKYLNND